MKDNFAICTINEDTNEITLTIFHSGKLQAGISVTRAEKYGRGYTESLFSQFERKVGLEEGSTPLGIEFI